MDTSQSERRTFDRYTFDGAKVRFLVGKNFGWVKKFSHDFMMKDISRSGLRLEVDQYRDPGSKLEVIINIPGKANFHMCGEVRWVSDVDPRGIYELGIMFAPYGSRKGYNAFRHKDRLKNMFRKQEVH